MQLASRETRQRHADEAANNAAMKSVARIFGLARRGLDPAIAPPRHIRIPEILVRKLLAGPQKLNHRFGQQHARRPSLIHTRSGEHIGAA